MCISLKKDFIQLAFFASFAVIFLFAACQRPDVGRPSKEGHRFMVLDPGHFHAALVFKRPGYEGVSSDVGIYAPIDVDFVDHMARVIPFNTRKENPASWKYSIYLGPDYQERMFKDKFGDVVVLSGENNKKIDRISASIDAGFNVFSDKPWVIDPDKFSVLEYALNKAEEKGLIAYDLMTERYEITSILQKLIVGEKSVFGEAMKGTPENPAVVKKSVHHLFKYVAGVPLKRPWWYFDVSVQGEAVVDVTTHLVDIVFFILYPGRAIDYKNDVKLISASHWPTMISSEQFEKVTGVSEFPPQFELNSDGILPYMANGKFVFQVDGINAQAWVEWHYKAPEGAGDTHYSIIKGSKCNLLILQGAEQKYKPELYIEPAKGIDRGELKNVMVSFIDKLASGEYPGIKVVDERKYFRIDIPDKYRIGHEAHFGQVTDAFLGYLGGKPMLEWEKTNMLAKYYLTTGALELCRKGDG